MSDQQAIVPNYECICQAVPNSTILVDYCELVHPNEGRALCEYTNDGTLFYWVNLIADELPVTLCCFEKYVDVASLPGRKTDYLAVGRYRNNTYVIFIELRKELLSNRQWEDKRNQVEQAIRLLCKTETPSGASHHDSIADIFTDAAGNMGNHKVVGVVIPAQKAKKRFDQIREVVCVGGKDTIILPVSPKRRFQPTLSWNELLEAIGL